MVCRWPTSSWASSGHTPWGLLGLPRSLISSPTSPHSWVPSPFPTAWASSLSGQGAGWLGWSGMVAGLVWADGKPLPVSELSGPAATGSFINSLLSYTLLIVVIVIDPASKQQRSQGSI